MRELHVVVFGVIGFAACGKVNGIQVDAGMPDASGPQHLIVMPIGTGVGHVSITSDVGGIACGATCDAMVDFGTTVTLTATPAGAARWSGGGCSGTDPCVVSVTEMTTVTAAICTGAMPTTLTAMTMIQSYTPPAGCETLTIDAFGAQGGGATSGAALPGLGAEIRGTVTVGEGEALKVLVGGAGQAVGTGGTLATYGYSGGGGSFVTRADNTPLVIAGGGGGGSINSIAPGGPGNTGTAGGDEAGALGGDNGNGGPIGATNSGGCGYRGSGGGGLLTDGDLSANGGGTAFVNGGAGGVDPTGDAADCATSLAGGFGGGGAGGNGGGGGGGYSGGAGGNNGTSYTGGGGGGSFNAGTNPLATSGVRSGAGQVIMTPAL